MNLFTLKVALRYLFSKKTHSAVNIITIVAVCSVAVTTTALVCVLSVFNGFSSLVESKLALLDPEVKIFPASGKVISNADSLIKVLSTNKEIQIMVPTIEDNALAVFGEKQMPIKVKGVTNDYSKSSSIVSTIKSDGHFQLSDSTNNFSIVSVGVALGLGAHPGYVNYIQYFAPRRVGRINIANPMNAFVKDSTLVAGVFQIEQGEYDNNMVILPLSVTRTLFDYTTEASAIEIQLKPSAQVEPAIAKLQASIGNNFIVKDRLQQQDTSFKLINIEKWITFLLLAFILIIATFNVISTLSVLIIEKQSNITTLRNLGATNSQISNVFVTEGWLITILGAIVGIIFGIILCLVQQYFGIIKLNGDPTALIVHSYPVAVKAWDIVTIFILTAFVALITSFATAVVMHHRLNK